MNLGDNLCSGRNRRGEAFCGDIHSHLRWMKAVNTAGGVFPVGGATGVRYTRRSAAHRTTQVIEWQELPEDNLLIESKHDFAVFGWRTWLD